MALPVFLEVLMIIVLLYVGFSVVLKGRARMWGIAGFSVLLVAFFVCGFQYFANHAFRMAFDARFHQTKEYVNFETGAKLPLPPKTAYSYRSSERSVTFFTLLSEQEIKEYLRGISDQGSELVEKEGHGLEVTYHQQKYKFVLEKATELDGEYLHVEAK